MRVSSRMAAMVVGMTAVVLVQETSAAKILIATPVIPPSHMNFFMPLAEHLAQRNHTVTLVSGLESTKEQPNIKVVFVPNVQIFGNMPNLFTTNPHTAMFSIFDDMLTACVKALKYEGVQNLKDEKFDLVILHAGLTECFLSFVHRLKVPHIFVLPNRIIGALAPVTRSPSFPSLSASFLLDLEYPLTFMGRMTSTLYDLMGIMSNDWVMLPSQEGECRALQLCPEDMPSLYELRLNSSLFIANSIRTMETPPLPYAPTVVHAGGIHCRPAKPLPEDLQQWVEGAGKHGFIFFSLGSLVKASTMPEKYRKVLVEVLGSLQQRVLWKWDEDTMEDLPPNVRLSKWLPQQDILGHPDIRLFITHGGLFSTQEATYHGVPVLGIPVSIDQYHNMRMVQSSGWGHVLYWEDLTYDSFRGHIIQLMVDQRVREEVQWRSKVMRDQPMSPGDWATYWIEYVLRYQGATHLRSPTAQMPWYQLYNVDVWGLLVAVTVVTVGLSSWLTYRILRALIRCSCGSRKKKED